MLKYINFKQLQLHSVRCPGVKTRLEQKIKMKRRQVLMQKRTA